MTPFEQARTVYDHESCARTFAEDLQLHLHHGYVVSTPTTFAMARPVGRHWSYKSLADPSMVDPQGNCWWIWMLSGELREALSWLPDQREWIGYERKNVPRFFLSAKFPLQFPRVVRLPLE